ncbi:MAG: ATP-binding protein [Planctomycetes bacterium]|nr:ATP-binding protein [Planctomycetota bacterium]
MTSGETDSDWMARVLAPYNPWWADPAGPWRRELPSFERPVLDLLWRDFEGLRQALSVTGPRRIGKTTILRQLIVRMLDRKGMAPERILYFSFDEPSLLASGERQAAAFDLLAAQQGVKQWDRGNTHYFLLDEIQRLPYWELHLKKFYDQGYPIRFIVSGSASVPIFRKSRESLVGRIMDHHLLPFSFREYCLFRLAGDSAFSRILGEHAGLKERLLRGDGAGAFELSHSLEVALEPYRSALAGLGAAYWRHGGLPEVWEIDDPIVRQEFLWDNQVRRVLFGDLAQVSALRKPENVTRLVLYLLSNPGVELNVKRVAGEAGVGREVVEDNLPLLEMADLIRRVRKFRAQPYRVRESNVKSYVVDLALRNAVLKLWDEVPGDDVMAGLYAENVVAIALSAWPETVELSYYRRRTREVDFIVTHSGAESLPVEVKYRRSPEGAPEVERFMGEFRCPLGVVVTRESPVVLQGGVLSIPLWTFLLAV